MYEYQEFLPKDEKLNAIKTEVSKVEAFINNCLEKVLACTSFAAERDYNVSAM